MTMLKSKLLDLKEKEHKEKIEDLKGIQMDIAWGSQIRSYVFCPYTMVKDHRTNYEVRKCSSSNGWRYRRVYRSLLKTKVIKYNYHFNTIFKIKYALYIFI